MFTIILVDIPGANRVSPTNFTVPFLCPATITLSPTSISASDDMEDARDLLRPMQEKKL